MVPVVEEVLEHLRMRAGSRQRQADELGFGRHGMDGRHHGVIARGIVLAATSSCSKSGSLKTSQYGILKWKSEVCRLPLPVRETALGIPAHQARVVIGEILQAALAQFLALGVIPNRFVGIGRISHRLIGLEKPRGNGAEVQDGGVAFGGVEEIDGHRVDERRVPRARLEFGDRQFRVRKPGDVADVLRAQIVQGAKDRIVDGGSAPQRRIDDHLQGGGSFRNLGNGVPANVQNRSALRVDQRQRRSAKQQKRAEMLTGRMTGLINRPNCTSRKLHRARRFLVDLGRRYDFPAFRDGPLREARKEVPDDDVSGIQLVLSPAPPGLPRSARARGARLRLRFPMDQSQSDVRRL